MAKFFSPIFPQVSFIISTNLRTRIAASSTVVDNVIHYVLRKTYLIPNCNSCNILVLLWYSSLTKKSSFIDRFYNIYSPR